MTGPLDKIIPLFEEGVIVTIEQQDIDAGGHTSTTCPIARALHRNFPDFKWTVNAIWTLVEDRGKKESYGIFATDEVYTRIRFYDQAHQMEPGRLLMTTEGLFYLPGVE